MKVLIVDDSRIFRSAVERSLKGAEDVRVIGSVHNGVKALEFIRRQRPDLVTLDVEMPEMDGLETLSAIQAINADEETKRPIGTIMLSAQTHKGAETTIKALEMGAFDFVTKPRSKGADEGIQILRRQLLAKTRYFQSRTISSKRPAAPPTLADAGPTRNKTGTTNTASSSSIAQFGAIVIGVSTGGPQALANMLPQLCEHTNLPIFIAQHMPPTFTECLANSLNARCSATVTEGQDLATVQSNHVTIVPGGKQMELRRRGARVYTVLDQPMSDNACLTSVDVLFRSAATVYHENVLALILTGMGADGTEGIRALKRAGAYVIAQDEASSVVWGMPGSAVQSGNVDQVVSLKEMPQTVADVLQQHA